MDAATTPRLEFDYRAATLGDLDTVWPRDLWITFHLAHPGRRGEELPTVRLYFVGIDHWGTLARDLDPLREACRDPGIPTPLCRRLEITKCPSSTPSSTPASGPTGAGSTRSQLLVQLDEAEYHADFRSVVETLLPDVDAPTPRATTAHLCDQCHVPLLDSTSGEPIVIGRRRTMVLCPSCDQGTSCFALQHRCPGCSALLESPEATTGGAFACPECDLKGAVPEDLLRALDDPTAEDWIGYVVECPGCDREWLARRANVDRSTVCGDCRTTFRLPRIGRRTDSVGGGSLDVERRCTACRELIPAAARSCPYCRVAR